ncbi:MAG: hypothetical protein ACREPM_25125, partial [Gemmatimonadaceae bacterium]
MTIKPGDTLAVVDAKLANAVSRLAAVQVQARKARPTGSLGNNPGFATDATDRSIDGVVGALPPDLQGNLEAMASFIPGLALGASGLSAFGLGADANSTTLNGLAFGGTDLPRDAQTNTRFRTSPWDPTIGGFSGVQTSSAIGSGGNVTTRRGHVTLDAPSLQFSDPVASRLGQKYTNIALDEGGVGAFRLDKYFYNFGIHVARNTADVSSLTDLDADALSRAGVSRDSALRLISLLGGYQVPLTVSGIPHARTTSTISYLERFDKAPEPTPANRPRGPVVAATVIGKYSEAEALSLTPTLSPASSGKTTNALAGVQGLYTRYFGKDGDYLSETTSGLSLTSTRGTPYLDLPGGSVLVTSPDGIGSLGFGGNSALASDNRVWTWETINQTDFLWKGHQSLPMKLYVQSRYDDYTQSLAANRLGRFSYASLTDLANNEPSSFSRTLDAPDRSGGEWIGAAALGASYTSPGAPVSLTGGLRVDANAFTAVPQYNADVDRTFGARTDHAPNGVDLSPRIGMTWRYWTPHINGPSNGMSIMSSGAAIAMRGPQVLRFGAGKFRSVSQPTLLADAISSTGLPGGTQQLSCIGAAAPIPDWSAYADPSAIPSTCAGGTAVFTDSARAVTLFDRHYAPPESWRGNVGWTASSFLGFYLSVDATYSYNLQQSGTVDLNFAGTPKFALPLEANRPVFVSSSSIVPATGALSPVDARLSAAYGRVADRVSDLHGDARQIAVTALPNLPFAAGLWFFGYTYADTRAQLRG